MKNAILNNKTPMRARTKDLVIAETILLSLFFLAIIWSFFSIYTTWQLTAFTLSGPLLYTILWRFQSIKHEKSNPKQDLQSGVTLILFIWSCLECMLLLPGSFVFFIESISQDFYLVKVFDIIPFLTTSLFLFYLFKSFVRSMKIDVVKPSIQ